MYGAKITSIRMARGYTQEYMAKKVGIDQQTYSRIEKDAKSKIDDTLLSKIAETLGVSLEDIKCPLPIVMQFTHSPNSGIVNAQSVFNDPEVISSLLKQLQEKDEQISKLIELLAKKNKNPFPHSSISNAA